MIKFLALLSLCALNLAAQKSGSAAPAGSVSFASLSHKVPRQAQRAFDAAENARKHADEDAWSRHLQEALAIDSQFAPAHNDLAIYYVRHKMFDQALAEIDQAAALDSGAAPIQINRVACLAVMGRLDQAEIAARRAVQLTGASPRARYALGLVLADAHKLPSEALDNLLAASDAFPNARLVAAQILLNSGHTSDARTQLRRYLQTCSGDNCESVQSSLDRLNSTQ
jgi:Tfp pilus assembly protein PilF